MTNLVARYFSTEPAPETAVVIYRGKDPGVSSTIFVEVRMGTVEHTVFRSEPELAAWLADLRDKITAAIGALDPRPAAEPAPDAANDTLPVGQPAI